MKHTSQGQSVMSLLQFLTFTGCLSLRIAQCFPLCAFPLSSSTRSSSSSSGNSYKSSSHDRRTGKSDWILRSRIRHQPLLFTQLYSTEPSNNAQTDENAYEDEIGIGGRDLYETLNASPTDSTQTLKQKYRELARQTHPDALIGTDSEYRREQAAIQFAEITAAYRTLTDPKTRLQYDRTLKAKEFTENVVDSLEGGFRAAFKTAYQTAGTIRSVGAQIDKAREETAYRLELASKIAQYNTQSKTLKQRAFQEENRRKELQERLDNRESRNRHPWLEQNNYKTSYKYKGPSSPYSQQSSSPNQELTSTMANEIVKNLKQRYQTASSNTGSSNFGDPANAADDSSTNKDDRMEETVTKTIEKLSQVETEVREVVQAHVQSQKEMARARAQLDGIQEQEERALKALEAAQAAYETAKEATLQQEREYGEVLRQERVSYSNVEMTKITLSRQQDRTKETLRQAEDMYIWKENSWLRDEARKAQSLSEKLRDKSVELQKKADELKRELDSLGKRQ